jgi:hypothetical protein
MARNTSGAKVFIDLLSATHGPQNIPETIAARRMLIHSHTFRVMALPFAIQALPA